MSDFMFVNLRASMDLSMIPELPVEILLGILSNLDVQTLCSLGATSKTWHAITDDDQVWREICIRDFPWTRRWFRENPDLVVGPATHNDSAEEGTWKDRYIDIATLHWDPLNCVGSLGSSVGGDVKLIRGDTDSPYFVPVNALEATPRRAPGRWRYKVQFKGQHSRLVTAIIGFATRDFPNYKKSRSRRLGDAPGGWGFNQTGGLVYARGLGASIINTPGVPARLGANNDPWNMTSKMDVELELIRSSAGRTQIFIEYGGKLQNKGFELNTEALSPRTDVYLAATILRNDFSVSLTSVKKLHPKDPKKEWTCQCSVTNPGVEWLCLGCGLRRPEE